METDSDKLRIRMSLLNAHITCYICQGYFVDATTVLDCLHTFCKSCLLKHFEQSPRCPKCEILIHQSHPAHYVSADRTMQDLVYKLVPDMQELERTRREHFCRAHKLPMEELLDSSAASSMTPNEGEAATTTAPHPQTNDDPDYHRRDEQVTLHLHPDGTQIHPLKRQVLRCSSQATVTHLKKYLATKLLFDQEHFCDFDIFCNRELMGKDHSLKFIQRTRWRNKQEPLELAYRKHVEF